MLSNKENFVKLNEVTDLDALVDQVAEVLKNDGVLLTPTDTVYGILCIPDSMAAIKTIFDMKQRPMSVNLPIIVADKEQAKNNLPTVWTEEAELLAKTYWPGYMTIACGIRENDIPWLKGRVEVGIRVPNHLFIQKLAGKLGPLLMTSANRHGVPTPHTVEGALESLAVEPAFAIDGGELSGLPSTLVNVNLPKPVVEREGVVSREEIERLFNEAR